MSGDPWEKVAAAATAQHGVVGRHDLRRAGVGPDQLRVWLRTGRLTRRGHHAFAVAGAPPSWAHHLMAAQLDTGGVVSHRAAAALWELDTFRGTILELTLPRRRRNVTRPGIALHSSATIEGDHVALGPFRVTKPARTLVDLAGLVAVGRLEHAVDSALRRELVTLDGLVLRLDELRHRGRDGVRRLDAVLRGRHPGQTPESVLERLFLRLVRAHGLPSPDLQVIRLLEDGGRVRVDAQYTEPRVVVEIDGHAHHASRRQRQRDAERDAALALEGWVVLRFTYDDVVERPTYVARTIRRALARASAAA